MKHIKKTKFFEVSANNTAIRNARIDHCFVHSYLLFFKKYLKNKSKIEGHMRVV